MLPGRVRSGQVERNGTKRMVNQEGVGCAARYLARKQAKVLGSFEQNVAIMSISVAVAMSDGSASVAACFRTRSASSEDAALPPRGRGVWWGAGRLRRVGGWVGGIPLVRF